MTLSLRPLFARLPWNRRADRAAERADLAAARLARVRADTPKIAHHVNAITAEVELNDWTRTAKRIFSGA